MANPLCHATTVIYNGIEIRNVLTESMDSTTVYDSTGVDPIGVRVQMTFTGEIYSISDGDYNHGYGYQAADENNLAPAIDNIVHKFLSPRRLLEIKIGNDTLYYVIPGANAICEPQPSIPSFQYTDIANGPRTTCRILAVKGSRSAKCRFTVEFTMPPVCKGTIGDVLNVRWRVGDDIDCKTWLTRRTYEGMIRFTNRNINFTEKNFFDYARQYAFPPLLRGFRRESISYHEQPNGLEVSFIVVDQEVFSAAPSPATFWDGTYTVTMAQAAVACTQNLTFTLKGDPNVDKTSLLTLAMYIIDSKLSFNVNRPKDAKPPNFMLMSAMFQERLPENEINVSITTWSASINGDNNFLANLSQADSPGKKLNDNFTLGQPLKSYVSDFKENPYRETYHPKYSTMPMKWPQPVSFLMCMLQNPCCVEKLGEHVLPTDASPAIFHASEYVSEQKPIIYDSSKTLYSESHEKSAYEYYRMSNEYSTDTGWRGFPLGTQCNKYSSPDEPTVAFSRMFCGIQTRKVTINAIRINSWPELPKPIHWIDDSTTPPVKHILKDYSIEAMPVQLSADGCDTVHELVAKYEYYLDRPYKITEDYKLPVGRLAYVSKERLAETNPTTAGGLVAEKRAIDYSYFIDPKDLLSAVDAAGEEE